MSMEFSDWLKSNVDYGKELIHSGVEGARSTRDAQLEGERVSSVLAHSAGQAWKPATVGASLGVGAYLLGRRKPNLAAVLSYSLLGATIGFTVGMAWETRRLTGSMARGAMRGIQPVRDAHWLERNPINYG
jgi:hypothetical protein